jgi:hypothetical protein
MMTSMNCIFNVNFRNSINILEGLELNEIMEKLFNILFFPQITKDYIFNEILKAIIIFSLENIKSNLKATLRLVDCIPSVLKYLKCIKYQPKETLNKLKYLKNYKKILVVQKLLSEKSNN